MPDATFTADAHAHVVGCVLPGLLLGEKNGKVRGTGPPWVSPIEPFIDVDLHLQNNLFSLFEML